MISIISKSKSYKLIEQTRKSLLNGNVEWKVKKSILLSPARLMILNHFFHKSLEQKKISENDASFTC